VRRRRPAGAGMPQMPLVPGRAGGPAIGEGSAWRGQILKKVCCSYV